MTDLETRVALLEAGVSEVLTALMRIEEKVNAKATREQVADLIEQLAEVRGRVTDDAQHVADAGRHHRRPGRTGCVNPGRGVRHRAPDWARSEHAAGGHMTADQFAAGIGALIAQADDDGLSVIDQIEVLDRIVKAMKDALTSGAAEDE